MTCKWCKKEYDKPLMKSGWTFCPHCGATCPEGYSKKIVDIPSKGSERWNKERWFRKDHKTWVEDIKSRKSIVPDGSVVGRFNNRGERIG